MTPVKEEEVAQDEDEEMADAAVKQEPQHESEQELDNGPIPAQAASSEKRPTTGEESEEEEEEDAEKVTAAVLEEVVDAAPLDEEEHSLLDPPISPIPREAPQPPPPPAEPEGPKPRLVIYKMALINFKSYAGRQDIGPFHKSFSAIVGPNGSGKSNTIDALLFVFGFRATKMRQGKLSELIHNSAKYPDLRECSVEVHFREIIDLPGPDAFEVVPNSNLVVSRTAFKDNTSKYMINGRASTYKEVQTLLKDRGIDLDHNRFLILQGEVESIAQMKPKAANKDDDGLLEYLEDIIGTAEYKEQIEDTLAEVERLSDLRQEKLNRLKIVEKDRNALEAQKKEAEDYLRMVNDLTRARSRLWQWYIWHCLINEAKLSQKIAEKEKELQEEQDQNKGDIKYLEELEEHFEEKRTAYEDVKKAADAAVKDLAAREKTQISLQEKRKHANSKAKKLTKSINDDESNKTNAEHAIEDSNTKIEEKKQELERLEADLSQAEKVLEEIRDSLKDRTQVFHDQIEVKQKELQPWMVKINSKQAEIDVAKSERDALKKKGEEAKAARERAEASLEELREELQTKTAELEGLKREKAKIQNDLRGAEREFQTADSHMQNLRAKASASRAKADETRSSQERSHSNNRVLDGLNRLKSQGRISGFHGRLGALGTIPDKFDVAVSTACGALSNMVVDTVEQGQACIEYLRSQQVGRASFMVLEKLSNRGMERIQTPENVPRLFDLIKPKEPRFAPAFYKGLGNTLVAENLDQANRIAFGGSRRWRVVTLAGQLIDSSGTMSGGGTTVQRGAMSSKLQADAESPETIRRYQEESERDQRELEQAQQQLQQLETRLDDLKQAGPRIDNAIDRLNLEIKNCNKRIADSEQIVRNLKSQSKPDAGDVARIAALDRDIDAASSQLEQLQGKANGIEKEIKALENKILEIGGARLLSQKSKVDGIRLHINLANDELTKAEVTKAKAEKDLSKFTHNLKANRQELEEVEAELADLKEQLEEVQRYMVALQEQVNVAQAAAEQSSDDLAKLKEELDQKTEEIQAFRQREMKIHSELETLRKKFKENKDALDHWMAQHETLQLEDVDDEDEEEGEGQAANAEGAGGGGDVDDDGSGDDDDGEGGGGGKKVPVKKESGGRKTRARSPSHELKTYTEAELATFNKAEMLGDTELLDEKVKNAKPDLSVLKDYQKREEEFLRRAADLSEVSKLRDEKKAQCENLKSRRLKQFLDGFNQISLKLKEMYQMITLGGNAELELVDTIDPFSEGIIFSVMPPKKSWKNISNLSGGEKTLSSLALVFALHVYKPTPLYFMDEIDAALDFRNVSIVANYIKDRTKNAQFIIISLRNDMFELSHRLIGIYKTANATRSISIDNHALNSIPVNAVPVAS
ncbi:RecF/RecN/SMC protein [Ganoderma leucocontextum]|nr:RecF/RecN/SMC protein [Ganoderma leucocontextum]